MSARIIDGKTCAAALRAHIASATAQLSSAHGVTPGLAVVLVGEDPASSIYVRNKGRQSVAAGMASFEHRLPAETSEADLLGLIARLNHDPAVHGILVQLPLPAHIDATRVIESVDPAKDVDGFHPVNAGRLSIGLPGLVPCTPLGCLRLIKTVRPDLSGADAVVVGRSNIVGKPVAQLLLAENCTVAITHSRTQDLADHCRQADVLVAAAGRPEFIKGGWIKPGAIVIDVGINRIFGEDGTQRLIGDVAFEAAAEVASAITPVPGGVGPMTIACLLANTLRAACAIHGLQMPDLES